MRDQATQLRNLVLRTMRERQTDIEPCPRMLLVTGGHRGVGVTTLAVNLAIAWAEIGARVVLIDADTDHGQVAGYCGIKPKHSIADVLSAHRSIHEVLERGPAGVQVVPGITTARQYDRSALATERLLRQTRSLGRHADIVLVDAGANHSELAQRYWAATDSVVLVTTPQSRHIMDAYALVKCMLAELSLPELSLVVNRAPDQVEAQDVHRRMAQSCERFLQLDLKWLGQIPDESPMPANVPLSVQSPEGALTQAYASLAQALAEQQPAMLRPVA